jgi:hypothetical protein
VWPSTVRRNATHSMMPSALPLLLNCSGRSS